MRKVCVDANLVVKWLTPEEERDEALAFLAECRGLGVGLIAPDCMYAEVGASIRRKVYRGLLDEADGFGAISVIDRFGVDVVPALDLMADAWYLAAQYNLATLYDAYYMALAELRGCDFWTADERFINSVRGVPYVRRVADFSPGSL